MAAVAATDTSTRQPSTGNIGCILVA